MLISDRNTTDRRRFNCCISKFFPLSLPFALFKVASALVTGCFEDCGSKKYQIEVSYTAQHSVSKSTSGSMPTYTALMFYEAFGVGWSLESYCPLSYRLFYPAMGWKPGFLMVPSAVSASLGGTRIICPIVCMLPHPFRSRASLVDGGLPLGAGLVFSDGGTCNKRCNNLGLYEMHWVDESHKYI